MIAGKSKDKRSINFKYFINISYYYLKFNFVQIPCWFALLEVQKTTINENY